MHAISVSRRVACRATTAAACLAALLTLAAQPASAAPGDTLGVYRGAASPGEVRAYEAWLGRPVYRVHDFLADDDWSKIANPTWWLRTWGQSPYGTRMMYSVPMLPRTGGTLAQGAAGAYNGYFRQLAQRLVAEGQGAVTLRLGWEFNGDWYRWRVSGVAGGAASYAAYWRQIVATMRSVPGAAFTFDWCTNNGSVPSTLNPETAYPGDAYVDYISQDVYDQAYPATRDPATRWASIAGRPYGLNWLVGFAARHGKRIAIPEWGLGYNAYGGGDDPYFVAQMYAFIARTNPAYHVHWEYSVPPRLMTGRNPRAAAEFRRLFGPQPAVLSPAPAPAPVGAPVTTRPAAKRTAAQRRAARRRAAKRRAAERRADRRAAERRAKRRAAERRADRRAAERRAERRAQRRAAKRRSARRRAARRKAERRAARRRAARPSVSALSAPDAGR